MNDEIQVVGVMEVWSDDPVMWLWRVYTENVEMQRKLEAMGLRVVAVYSQKGRVIGRDYRTTKAIVEKLIAKYGKEGRIDCL